MVATRERSGDAGPEPGVGALFRGKAFFWVPIAPLVALDLWSKSAVFAHMQARFGSRALHAELPVWDGPVSLSLRHWYNTGTVWGLFRDFNTPLVVLRIVAIGVLLWFARATARRARGMQLVLGMILAGAAGNLHDNLTVDPPGLEQFKGGVRDFLSFTFHLGGGEWEFPAFNVADSCITVGAISLIFLLWRRDLQAAAGGEKARQASGS